MKTITDISKLPGSVRSGVLTLGNFDGMHLGHQRLLARARQRADEIKASLTIFTFEPPPVALLAPAKAPQRLSTLEQKLIWLDKAGADVTFVSHTDKAILALTPDDFVRRILIRHFHPKIMVEGPRFHFGKNHSGNLQTLRELGEHFGFKVESVESEKIDLPRQGETPISSTLIRELIMAGDMVSAIMALGREYHLSGEVIAGTGRGRQLGFPTANISVPENLLLPADGVYAAAVKIEKKKFLAAAAVGTAPTFERHPGGLEVHLLDFSGSLYGQHIDVAFHRRLRDHHRFDSPDQLAEQIRADCRAIGK